MSKQNWRQLFQSSSALSGANAAFIEDLYEQFLQDPDTVDPDWQLQFRTLQNGAAEHEIAHSGIRQQLIRLAQTQPSWPARSIDLTEKNRVAAILKQATIAHLIDRYRSRGHRQAADNPLSYKHAPEPELALDSFGFNEEDLEQVCEAETVQGLERPTLGELIQRLQQIYCGSISSEFMPIVNTDIRQWIIQRLEGQYPGFRLSAAQKKWCLRLLTAAEGIEKHLHRKYVGQKRFSLEGGESLIPMLDELIQRGGEQGVKEVVIGMAHRGRLNVLINILGKKPAALFGEFEGRQFPDAALPGHSGDVKYHMGFSSDVETPGGPVHLTLAFNPSHLEIINPVVEGSVRARQDRYETSGAQKIVPVLIHGDAALSGQGIVMETLNMSQTRGFATGGTVHIVINNQIGFTISDPRDARSTPYCTDIASMLQAPVFHVNGDDPEAVIFVTQMALDFRMKFKRDVVIDLICYRRQGHNEADEPSVTQPLMYQFIDQHETTYRLYVKRLVAEAVITETEARAMDDHYHESLENGSIVSRPILEHLINRHATQWEQYRGGDWDMSCHTAVPVATIQALSERLLHFPPGFKLQSRVAKIMANRQKMAEGILPLDWGCAENLAYATLLEEAYPVRLIGQDVGRGTFFHRHAILHNQLDSHEYVPLMHLSNTQAQPQIYDSLLSEAGVLGFEYGYSTTEADTLVIWEAQFGDFANGAQVVIDQFISSGEAKWGRLCGLTLLLPHGYEGQGPEHSSARLERFLQLCAEQNIQVCTPTTPAQIFHLLRRQVKRAYRKPLIVISPKSLLRHKLAVSSLEDLSQGEFQPLITEIDPLSPETVTRVILCGGKVFYDLLEARREACLSHVAIVRVEQLYPFPQQALTQELDRYPNLKELVWCQEEPQNQGAWHQVKHRFFDFTRDAVELVYAGRSTSAAPAVGYFKLHVEQQKALIRAALYGSEGQPQT